LQKNRNTYSFSRLLIIVCINVFFCIGVHAQPIYFEANKQKASRPFIDLNKVNDTAFEKGRIYLKVLPAFFPKQSSSTNHLLFFQKNKIVNAVNQQFAVQQIESLFPNILEDIERADLHKSWGFNCWFEINFDSRFSVKEVVNAYQSTGFFEVVEPVYKTKIIGATDYIPNDPQFSQQWHFKNTGQGGGIAGKDLQLTKAWEIEKGNPSVIVSVHDNALQLDHEDLAQNIAVGKSYNFTNNSPNLTLFSSHGTFCAGIIGAVNNNSIGVSSIAGGNGNANSGIRLMSCQTFSSTVNTGFAESFVYAADNGAAISSNSWGYVDFDVYNVAVLDAIDYFCEFGGGSVMQGGLVIFAAGNNGVNRKIYPGAYERVICVAASNNKDEKANYSNYGNWVDITAPGGENGGATGILSLGNFNTYGSSGGTSNACPQVAGVAALVTSILAGKTSASDVRDILLSTVDNHYSSNQNYIGLLGSGRLNAYKAVLKAKQFLQSQSVQSVSNVHAQLVCNTVNISYTKPQLSNNIIIVYNNTNDIGTLVDGKDYSVGDNLIGGGKVVYKGNASNFQQQIANTNDWHYFKIFTTNNALQYSYGYVVAKATKTLVKGNGIVLTENFNYPPLFPTKEWDNRNKNFVSSWIHTARDTSSTGAGDNYSMAMYNYSFNNVYASVDTLFSPYIWVKNADSIQLNFWHSYKYTPKNVRDADSLEVLVSTDCGQTFTSIWKKGGRNLTTTTDSSNKEWYPFAPNSFNLNAIQLNRFGAFEKIMIAFRGYNGGGNNLFIDNISVAVKYIQPDNFNTVAIGKNHTLSLTKNGNLWAWGQNDVGQLGNGKTNIATSLIKANNLSWINIAAGNDFSVGIAEDSTLWTWGLNNQAQLGNNSVQNTASPTKISSIINWEKVVCGDSHSLALQSNGNLWSWGLNDKGQLGDSSFNNSISLQQIAQSFQWKAIAAGGKHSLAIRKDGTLWAWGQNDVGQLGDGTNTDKWQPLQIGNAQNWKAIAAGNKHSLAIKTDGTLWAWGQNDEGQLGDHSFINKNNPVQVGSNTNWQQITAGFKHSIAITADSSLFTWGLNNLGQLGINSIDNKNNPTRISNHEKIIHVSANSSSQSSAFIKQDANAVCMSGGNNNYQLGIAHTQSATNFGCNYVWMGTQNNRWSNANNWGKNIPTSIDNVVVYEQAAVFPTIQTTETFAVKNLVIQPNSNLLISGTLQISDQFVGEANSIDATNGAIELNGSKKQFFDGNIFSKNTLQTIQLNNLDTVVIGSNFNVSKLFSVSNGVIDLNGKTIQLLASPLQKTAFVQTMGKGIVYNGGKFQSQHFIPTTKPMFRFITSGITTANFIQNNWQNNFGNSTNIGTHITGIGGSVNGFDESSTNSPSMFVNNNDAFGWQAIRNTNATNLIAGKPYKIWIRGDRTINLFSNNYTPNNTTLTAEGSIATGTINYNNLATNQFAFSSVGNPYIAPIDFEKLDKTNVFPSYWIWDSTIAGSNNKGGYIAYTKGIGSSIEKRTTNIIQPFEVFFIQNSAENPNLTFKESHKVIDTFSSNNSNTLYNIDGKMYIQLWIENNSNNLQLADGALICFGKDFTNKQGNEDAEKMMNEDENIAINNDNKLFAIEARRMPTTTDSIHLYINNLLPKNYSLQIQPTLFKDTNITVFIHDAFLQKQSPISVSSATKLNFSVTENPASKANNRFTIICRNNRFFNADSAVLTLKQLGNFSSNGGFFQLTNNINSPLFLQLFDVRGKLLATQKFAPLTNGTIFFHYQKKASGIYFIKASALNISTTIQTVFIP